MTRLCVDDLPEVRVAALRREGLVAPGVDAVRIAADGVEAVVRVAWYKMRSGGLWARLLCPRCNVKTYVLRLHEGEFKCRKCTGLPYHNACYGWPPLRTLRRAQARVNKLLATRFHGEQIRSWPNKRIPPATNLPFIERRKQLENSLARSVAIIREETSKRAKDK